MKIILGLSGGVDSAVSLAQLLKSGHHVEALFMKNWDDDDTAEYCSARQDLADCRKVCQQLGVTLHTIDFVHEYWQSVFQTFLDEHEKGRTPNPDILCNREIKFKAFYDHALKLGATHIATGHYVRTDVDSEGYTRLLRGHDTNKDQSYFLHQVPQAALQNSLFPVGHLPKSEVRAIATELDLEVQAKKDSTGICFIGERPFKSFLQSFLRRNPGDMVTPHGQIVGQHDGLPFYTLGQRKGLFIGGMKESTNEPWFVVGKRLDENALVVAQGDHPFRVSNSATTETMHWIAGKAPLGEAFEATCQCRYRQTPIPCVVTPLETGGIHVTFNEPVQDVTPGQSLVVYQGEVCLGGAVIESTDSLGGLNA